jgi:hypothetical protein
LKLKGGQPVAVRDFALANTIKKLNYKTAAGTASKKINHQTTLR